MDRPREEPAGRLGGIAALAGATTVWGSTYVVIKGALDDIGPFALAFARFAVVLPVLVPLAMRAGLRAEHLRLRRFWVFGATGVALYFGLQNSGIALTTAGSAALIAAAIPSLTALLAFVTLGERPSVRRWAGIAISTVGVALVVGSGLELGAWQAFAGNLLVLGSAAAWALYTVQGHRLGLAYRPIVSTTAGFLTGSVLLAVLAGAEVAVTGWPALTGPVVGAVLYLGFFASGLAILLWNVGVGRVEASAAGAFTNLVPIVGLSFGIALGEPFTATQLLGGALAAVGIFIVQTRRRR